MRSNTYTLGFTSAITIVLGFFLALVADNLRDRQELNVENDMKKNILYSLGFRPTGETLWTSDNIQNLFDENIEGFVLNTNGERTDRDPATIDTEIDTVLLPIYMKKESDGIGGYAIPIAGKGLWSTLFGYFAIEPDGRTVKGITFYMHGETPGLGGEVDKAWFQNNFVGKRFVDGNDELIGIRVLKGKVQPDDSDAYHKVDGISGATMTAKGLEKFLKEDLTRYDPFFKKVREGQG